MFDAERFGRGYGEENDFSLRAREAGWRSVIAADVFVFHQGAVSFSGERETLTAAATATLLKRHPGYSRSVDAFHAADPLHEMRTAIDDARHALGGDEARHVWHERALFVARERDANGRQRTEIGALQSALAHAESLVDERNAEIAKLTEAFRHAEKLALEREAELRRIRASPLGKWVLHWARRRR